MSFEVFVSLGSNMGDRCSNLEKAQEELSAIREVSILRCSSVYETDPVGFVDQGRFLNMVILLETGLQPLELLRELQKVELKLGRTREIRWGPRTLDIDILLMGDLQIDSPELTVPHPRMAERAFVLVPLKEICGDSLAMESGLDVLLEGCKDREGIRLYNCP